MLSLSQAIALAYQYLQSGQISQAESICQQILQQQPDCTEALFLLGAIAHQSGKLDEALLYYLQTIAFAPDHARAYYSLGAVMHQQGQLLEAITYYQQAIALQPDYSDAHYDLGNAFKQVGDLSTAIYHYQQAIAINPNDIEVRGNLANLLLEKGEIAAAIHHYQQVILLQPNIPGIYYNLGNALLEQRNYQQAIVEYQKAISLTPQSIDAYLGIATALSKMYHFEDAIAWLEAALKINPHSPEAYLNMGITLGDSGQVENAIANFQKALQLKPDLATAYWFNELALPVLYDNIEQIPFWRQRCCQAINKLINATILTSPESRELTLNIWQKRPIAFYLGYQGLNERGIQRKLGNFLHRVMAANYPHWVLPRPMYAINKNEKIRIGYISTHLRNHTVGKLTLGWLKNCDRKTFDIYTYQVAPEVDSTTEKFRSYSNYFHHIYGNIESICQQIITDKPHILVFTDIGMSPLTYQIAALSLAPVQCTTWGHPITSGLPTIDYFLSSDLMEPENARSHYSEKLIRLPNIGMCYEKPDIPELTKTRADFNLREDAILYFSCQSLFKYLPQFDRVFAEIAQRVPQAQFAFISHQSAYVNRQFESRLKRAFAELNLNSEKHCILLPRMNHIDYLNVNLLSDIFLDSFSWSGGNTTLEALACGLPVVTCPGEFMRGRHAYGILKMMEMSETIARDRVEYVDIAVRLGLDTNWRQDIRQKIYQRHSMIYNDKSCVVALESFYKKVVAEFYL
ncbi:MAG TPA: tetratricopeptide repeat protein [Leptolyngbyaceae cyanobacterium]